MKYELANLEAIHLFGKTFEFPTSEITKQPYPEYYLEIYKQSVAQKAYGIYNIVDDICRFTVALENGKSNNLLPITISTGTYAIFNLNMMEMLRNNQYDAAHKKLIVME